ncbi:aspartate racemase [Flavobacteriaceae bacterium CRH]|nr:aspartate racemase [Flavobacteriaceae bacterium CRH]
MKKIGLVGGISWISTIDYYKLINEGVNNKLGGLNFAECLIYSLNFGDVQEKTWEQAYELLLNACLSLKKSGVDALVLCANTAHMYADELEKETGLPLIHIGTETAKAITQQKIKTIGLLGTQFTMEMDFYKDRLKSFGLNILIPEKQETRDYMQHVLKEELGRGIINPDSKENYLKIANELISRGAEGIILGCTEIPLLIDQSDFSVPVFDTTKIHSEAIVNYILS